MSTSPARKLKRLCLRRGHLPTDDGAGVIYCGRCKLMLVDNREQLTIDEDTAARQRARVLGLTVPPSAVEEAQLGG